MTKAEALRLVGDVFEVMKERLGQGEAVSLGGFGGFTVDDKRARRGRHPQTGEPMVVDGRRVVTFQYAAQLRSMLNAAAGSAAGSATG